MKPWSMRLLIAEHNYSNGTETVSLGIVPELMKLVECVVWTLPNHRIDFYKSILPESDRLIYEGLFWPNESRLQWQAHGLLGRLDRIFPKNRIVAGLRERLTNSWLKHLIHKHRITHFFTTWIFNQEIPKLPVPIGAMAMDLNWHHFPENFPEDDRHSLDRLFSGWLNRADVVFPISEFTSEEIHGAFPKTNTRIKVVPHGARVLSPALTDAKTPQDAGQKRSYFYYPASVLSHKDHKTLIEAAITLFTMGYDFDLVFSGVRTRCLQDIFDSSDALSESLRKLISVNSALIKGRVKCLGILDREEVETLFEGARAVILPSRFEGFGLPLLEAVERGVPVICTDIPPFREQINRYDYGRYANVFPAGDVSRLVALMQTSLKSPMIERPLPDEIAAKTRRWTWNDAATAYVETMLET